MSILDELFKPRVIPSPSIDLSDGEGNTISRAEIDRRDYVKSTVGRAIRAPEQGFTCLDVVVAFNTGSLTGLEGPYLAGKTTEHFLSRDAMPYVIADAIRVTGSVRGNAVGLSLNTLPNWYRDDAGNWRMLAHETVIGFGSSRDRQLPPGRLRIGLSLYVPNATSNYLDWCIVTLFNRG